MGYRPEKQDLGDLLVTQHLLNGSRVTVCENKATGFVFYIVDGRVLADGCSVERCVGEGRAGLASFPYFHYKTGPNEYTNIVQDKIQEKIRKKNGKEKDRGEWKAVGVSGQG